MFLNLPAKLIGQVGNGKSDRNGTVDIAIIQSTHGTEGVKDFVAEYGHVIVDECHHLSAFTFEQVMKQVKAMYILGLTATPERKDGHHPIIYMQCGPIRHKLSARSMTAVTPFEHEVVPRLTEFCLPPERIDITIQEVYAALADDRARNEMILADLLHAVGGRRSPLFLTGRTSHLKYFETALSGKVSNVFVLKGGVGKKQRERLRRRLRLFRRASQESSWQLAVTLARALMMLVWTRCSWRCRFPGRERCNSMLGVSIGFTMLSMSFASTTMSILRC
jgi:superfamily II DNA or RNA helicase